jgi:anti-repressor protein
MLPTPKARSFFDYHITQQTINKSPVQTVNARELHAHLESKQEFANWIKSRIEQYDFVEGVDFTVDKFINGRSTSIDYHITLDMAKELSMVERNVKGREARLMVCDIDSTATTAQHHCTDSTAQQRLPSTTALTAQHSNDCPAPLPSTAQHRQHSNDCPAPLPSTAQHRQHSTDSTAQQRTDTTHAAVTPCDGENHTANDHRRLLAFF